jgi:hypothetical protein
MGRAGVREENLLHLASGQERFPLYWSRDARSISPLSLSELSALDQFDVEFLEKFQVDSCVLINNEHGHAFLQGYFGGYCLAINNYICFADILTRVVGAFSMKVS